MYYNAIHHCVKALRFRAIKRRTCGVIASLYLPPPVANTTMRGREIFYCIVVNTTSIV